MKKRIILSIASLLVFLQIQTSPVVLDPIIPTDPIIKNLIGCSTPEQCETHAQALSAMFKAFPMLPHHNYERSIQEIEVISKSLEANKDLKISFETRMNLIQSIKAAQAIMTTHQKASCNAKNATMPLAAIYDFMAKTIIPLSNDKKYSSQELESIIIPAIINFVDKVQEPYVQQTAAEETLKKAQNRNIKLNVAAIVFGSLGAAAAATTIKRSFSDCAKAAAGAALGGIATQIAFAKFF